MSTSSATNATPISDSAPTATALQKALQVLQPEHITLVNESISHAGYFEGKESHFKLTLVSNDFTGKRLVARHQLAMCTRLLFTLIRQMNGKVKALTAQTVPVKTQANHGSYCPSPIQA